LKPVITIAIAVVFLFVPQTVFGFIAVVPEGYVNETPTLDWAIMFVTTTDKCYSNHEKALGFYASLTQQYFDKFKFDHKPFLVECITDDNMPIVVDLLTKYADLTIVIPDYLMSVKDRHTTGSLGHYGFYDIKTIVSQAETIFPESKRTGWTLSHELAHFALDWKKYSNDIKREAVHEVQKQYNSCKSYDTTLTNCAFLWVAIRTPSEKWFPVMSPSYVTKIAESMKPKSTSSPVSPEPTCAKGTVLKNGICVTDTTQDDHIRIQKIKEVRGTIQSLYKTITSISYIDINAVNPDNVNQEYWNKINALKSEKSKLDIRFDASYQNLSVANNLNDKRLYIESLNLYNKIENELWSIHSGYNSYAKKLKDFLNTDLSLYRDKPPTSYDKTADAIALLSLKYSINGVQKSSGFEGDEVCLEYRLNLYPSVYPGSSSLMKFENVRVTKEIVNNFDDSILAGPFTTWHTTSDSGWVKICETLVLPDDRWYATYRYSAQYPGGSVAYSNAPTLSIYFEADPNNPYESEQEREQREFNELLVKEVEIALEKQQRVQAAIETARILEEEKTMGIVQWLETDYPVSGTGVVRIYDSDMDFNPEVEDSFNVDVWSDSDARGIKLTVTETHKSTGIFEETVFFTTTDESSSPRLKVAEGDTVTVEYEDRTLPYPYTTADELDITATTHMTDPICRDGTVLIDHICQVDKIEEQEKAKFCFLWWCWY